MVSDKIKQRLDEWLVGRVEAGGRDVFWHPEDEWDGRPPIDGVVAVSSGWADWAITPDGEFELYYLLETDEVWLTESPGGFSNAESRLKELRGAGHSIEAALLGTVGEPLARRTCPDTPEELLAWARMAASLVGDP